MAWQVVAGLRSLPAATRQVLGEATARVAGRIMVGAGGILLGLLSLVAVVRGDDADSSLVQDVHVLDALGDLLLVGGIALLLASLVFFPPFGAVAVADGGIVLVPTLTTRFVVLTSLGIGGVMLSQAADNAAGRVGGSRGGGTSRGSDPVPDIPRASAKSLLARSAGVSRPVQVRALSTDPSPDTGEDADPGWP